MSEQNSTADHLPEPELIKRPAAMNPYAIPLGTLVASAHVAAPQHVILQPELDGPGPGDAGGGADGGD